MENNCWIVILFGKFEQRIFNVQKRSLIKIKKQQNNRMGAICGSDIYKEVKQKYPTEFLNYLTSQEIKKGLTERVNSTESKVSSTANDVKKENANIFEGKEKELKDHFNSVKDQVDKNYLGGVKALEQMKGGKKLEDLLGFNDIIKKFEDIKTSATAKLTEEETKAKKELEDLKKTEVNKIDNNKPKLDYFEHLSGGVKNSVYNDGVKQFKDKIEAKSKQILGPLQGKLSPQSYLDKLKAVLPIDNLKNLTQLSKEQLDKAAKSLVGSPSQGKAVLF